MSFKYCGYDTQAMLYFIDKFSIKLTLESNGKEWVLNVIDNDIGDSESKHNSLSACIIKAFKPYKKMADIDRAESKVLIESIRS